MTSRPRTPQEIAQRRERKTYSYSLQRENAEKLADLARKNDLPVSELVDEAIASYLETLSKEDGKKKKGPLRTP